MNDPKTILALGIILVALVGICINSSIAKTIGTALNLWITTKAGAKSTLPNPKPRAQPKALKKSAQLLDARLDRQRFPGSVSVRSSGTVASHSAPPNPVARRDRA